MRNVSVRAYAYGVHVVIGFVVLATVTAELSPAFKNLLAGGFGHHWVAKSDIAIILFLVTAIACSRLKDPADISGLVRGTLLSATTGAIALFGFYLLHYVGIL